MYINNDMKLAAYKVNRGNGIFDYLIAVYRGKKPKRLDPRKSRNGFDYLEFTIQITPDSPLAESLEKLGVNTEYPIDITGFESSGDKVIEDAQRFSLNVNQAEVRTKDGSFESQYFECPNCHCPATPIVEVRLKIQDVDRFNSGDSVEVESGKVSFQCPNRECGNSGTMTYRDLILRKSLAGKNLHFFRDEVSGDAEIKKDEEKYFDFDVEQLLGRPRARVNWRAGFEEDGEEEERPDNFEMPEGDPEEGEGR